MSTVALPVIAASKSAVEASLDLKHSAPSNTEVKAPETDKVDIFDHIKKAVHSDKLEPEVASAVSTMEQSKSQSLPKWRWARDLLYHRISESDDYPWLIYVPPSSRNHVLRFIHDYQGHMGREKTLARLSRTFWFPQRGQAVRKFVKACQHCQNVKAGHNVPFGELHPTPNPMIPWSHIHMDFMGPLPTSIDVDGVKFDQILVTIDRTTRRIHAWPTHTTDTAQDIALLLGERYVPLHGIPVVVTTDRGVQFMNDLFQALTERLNISHHASTAFHKEPNGLVERMNRTVGEMLRNFTNANPGDWKHWLPLVELFINSSRLANADYTPFELDCGQNPLVDPVFHPLQPLTPHESVDELAEILQARRQDVAELWAEASRHAKERYDDKHEPLKFKPGDLVMISTQDIAEFKQKLSVRWVGPAKVREANPDADIYRLELPPVVSRIHDWLHVSRLKPYTPPIEAVKPLPPEIVDGHEEWIVEKIIRASYFKKSGRGWRYLVKWKGYPESECSWLWAHELGHAPEIVAEYHAKHPSNSAKRSVKPASAATKPNEPKKKQSKER